MKISLSTDAKIILAQLGKVLSAIVSFCAFVYGWFADLTFSQDAPKILLLIALIFIPIFIYLRLQNLRDKLEGKPWAR